MQCRGRYSFFSLFLIYSFSLFTADQAPNTDATMRQTDGNVIYQVPDTVAMSTELPSASMPPTTLSPQYAQQTETNVSTNGIGGVIGLLINIGKHLRRQRNVQLLKMKHGV